MGGGGRWEGVGHGGGGGRWGREGRGEKAIGEKA